MSIENAIVKLAESIASAADRLATALDKNSDAAVQLAGSRAPSTTNVVNKVEGEPVKADAGQEPADKKPPAKKKTPAKKKAPAKKEPEPEEDVEPETEAETDESKPSFDDVRAAAVALRDELGQDAVAKARKALNVDTIKELPEINYGLFIRRCNDMIAASAAADDGDL